MSNEIFSSLQQLADEAPEAGYINVNYGKLTINPMVVSWPNEAVGGKKTPKKVPLKAGYVLNAQESLELEVLIDIQEFNQELQFSYKKNVPVKKSGTVLTDWGEIVEPSLIAVFGKAWTSKAMLNPYVEVEDVAGVSGKASDKGKVYTAPKFLRAFENKAECAAAREAKYGKKAGGSSSAPTNNTPPDAVLKQVKALIGSVGADATLTMLESKSFGDFEPANLLKLAQEYTE